MHGLGSRRVRLWALSRALGARAFTARASGWGSGLGDVGLSQVGPCHYYMYVCIACLCQAVGIWMTDNKHIDLRYRR